MSNATLEYSGRMSIDTNDDGTVPQAEREKLHALLDDAIAGYEGDELTLKTSVVHFEREDTVGTTDMPRAHVDLSASGAYDELATVETTLAEQAVAIGLEESVQDAKDTITVG